MLDEMTILEVADLIKEKAKKVAQENTISEQEAYEIVIKEIRYRL